MDDFKNLGILRRNVRTRGGRWGEEWLAGGREPGRRNANKEPAGCRLQGACDRSVIETGDYSFLAARLPASTAFWMLYGSAQSPAVNTGMPAASISAARAVLGTMS